MKPPLRRAALALLISATQCAHPPARPTPPLSEAPEPAPLASDQKSFHAQTKGRITVVDLWASWCEACVRSMPELQRLHNEGRIQVIGVNVGEDRETAQAFLKSHGIDYPNYLDPAYHFADRLGVRALPTLFVLRADGTTAHRSTGLDATIRTHIEAATRAARTPQSDTSTTAESAFH